VTLDCVFLDFGHTLAHERTSRAAVYADVARQAGHETTEEAMAALMQAAHDSLPQSHDGAWRYSDAWFTSYIARIFRDGLGLSASACDELTPRLFERFSDPRTFELYPGTFELLGALKGAGLKIGVISNWSAHLEQLLFGLGVFPWLDVLVVSAVEELEKPDVRIFELALERAGARAERSLHAGDHVDKDCRGAQAAGLAAVLVDHRGDCAEPREFPCVRSLLGLRDHILGHFS